MQVAPYVVVNAPLFAKTDTFAINSAQLARLPARDAGWLRQAAQQAAATEATSAADRTMWATLCGQGLKPLALTGQQLTVLQNAEAPTYADLASDPQTALAIDRIGGLATSEPRMDSWATCHGVGIATSPTRALDGSYGILLRRRIAAPCHLQHRLSRERAGIGETDGVGVAESIPAWPTVAAVDAVPRSGAGRLHPQHQAGLLRIPDQVRGGVGTLALDDQLG